MELANLATSKDVGLIDVFNAMGGESLRHPEYFMNYQSADYCHPNDAGYVAMAAHMFKALVPPVTPAV